MWKRDSAVKIKLVLRILAIQGELFLVVPFGNKDLKFVTLVFLKWMDTAKEVSYWALRCLNHSDMKSIADVSKGV
jgi:hypothetical protein